MPDVLIISAPEDLHAARVKAKLDEKGVSNHILDLRRFPEMMSVNLRFNDAADMRVDLPDNPGFDLQTVASVWWRRPQRPQLSQYMRDEAHQRFAYNEATAVLNGLYACLDCTWTNPIEADRKAAYKPYQLKVAPAAGLTIPDTLITNDPQEALRFVEDHDREVIYKGLSGLPEAWRETRRLKESEIGNIQFVKHSPLIFQSLVEGNDLRVTVIGDAIFAAEMDTSASKYPYDVRMDMTVPIKAAELPEKVCDGLKALMAELGLVYGAIDLKKTSDGEYIFLEINPAGQFLYIEDLTGLPLTEAMSKHLANAGEQKCQQKNLRILKTS